MKKLDEILAMAAPTNHVPEGHPVGVVKEMGEYEIRHMEKFAQQVSDAFQPEMPKFLQTVETELSKFGYTLGQLDQLDDQEIDSMDEDLVIFNRATQEIVKNVYISLEWKHIGSKIYDSRPDALTTQVKMTINRVSEEEFDEIINNAENADVDVEEVTEETDLKTDHADLVKTLHDHLHTSRAISKNDYVKSKVVKHLEKHGIKHATDFGKKFKGKNAMKKYADDFTDHLFSGKLD